MTKQVTLNGFAKDIANALPLKDRTTQSSVRYFINKFIDDCEYNIKQKEKNISLINADAEELIKNPDGSNAIGAPHFNEDQLTKLMQNCEWNEQQIKIAQSMIDVLVANRDHIFPEETNAKTKSDALAYFKKRA